MTSREINVGGEMRTVETNKSPLTGAHDYYEECDENLRQLLGLRPTAYVANHQPGTHPDQRGCPPWCWVAKDPEYDHEFDPKRPMTATHEMQAAVRTVASYYRGEVDSSSQRGETAYYLSRLRQRGQNGPYIDLTLRHIDNDGDLVMGNAGCLTIADAKELVTALCYLIGVAEDASGTGGP